MVSEWFQNGCRMVSEWFQQNGSSNTNSDRTMATLVHVDDIVVTGTDDTVKELIQCLHGQYNCS